MRYRPLRFKSSPPSVQLLLYSLIAGLIIGIAALALTLFQIRLGGQAASENPQVAQGADDAFDGTIKIDPPIALPATRLTNTNNERMSVADLQGKPALITFGFTHCPDICPMTLSDFQRIQSLLDRRADDVHFVFISVDGQRDTPATLRNYFSFRQLGGILPLTGNEDELRAFGATFGLRFKVNERDASGGYSVNHTAGSFLLDKNGRWIMRYQFGVPPTTIAADLRLLLQA